MLFRSVTSDLTNTKGLGSAAGHTRFDLRPSVMGVATAATVLAALGNAVGEQLSETIMDAASITIRVKCDAPFAALSKVLTFGILYEDVELGESQRVDYHQRFG